MLKLKVMFYLPYVTGLSMRHILLKEKLEDNGRVKHLRKLRELHLKHLVVQEQELFIY